MTNTNTLPKEYAACMSSHSPKRYSDCLGTNLTKLVCDVPGTDSTGASCNEGSVAISSTGSDG